MNCRTATQAIALSTTGDLTPEDAEALASHLLICARCRTEAEIAVLITAALETDQEPAPGEDFTAHVLDRIREAQEVAPRERAWMPLIPAAALLSSIGAVWLALPLIPWREMASALGFFPPLASPAALIPSGSILPALCVLLAGLLTVTAREFATFMRE